MSLKKFPFFSYQIFDFRNCIWVNRSLALPLNGDYHRKYDNMKIILANDPFAIQNLVMRFDRKSQDTERLHHYQDVVPYKIEMKLIGILSMKQ